MTRETNREKELFADAIELPVERRAAFLNDACGEDGDLLKRVRDLLDAYSDESSLLRTAGVAVSGIAEISEGPGAKIGPYKLLQVIGEGGFGVVYMAEQKEPIKRRVALKIIKLGMDTKQVIARFESERQALALMDHPNIAKVLDAGATEAGRPYFVMELVCGMPLTKYCEQERLDTNARLDLFIKVCHAIQHAHQKGVIHRDIKPSNILVTLHDGVPAPKVIDFGIAKATQAELTEKTFFTQFHQMIGTPAYMSPEQVEMSSAAAGDIDTRTDIYSLGVLLYELLTGETPFETKELLKSGLDEMRRIIREQDPMRPSTRLKRILSARPAPMADRQSKIENDLDWIVMKAIEKDRSRRYDTAKGLANDIRRHLNNEPVEAAAPSFWYGSRKFLLRHRTAVTTVSLVTLALIVGTVVSVWQAIRATKAEERATLQAMTARRNQYASDMLLAAQAIDSSNFRRARELLQRHLPAADGAAALDLRGWEWRWLRSQVPSSEGKLMATLPGSVFGLDISSDGRVLAASTLAGGLKVLDTSTGREIAAIEQENGLPKKGVFFRGENRLLYGHVDRETYLTNGFLKVWNVASKRIDYVFRFHLGVGAKAVSPDGTKVLFNAPYHGMRMLDLQSKTVLWATPLVRQGVLNSSDSFLFSLPTGEEYLIGEFDGVIRFYSTATGNPTRRLPAHSQRITALKVAPDGSLLISAASVPETTIKVWDYNTLNLRGTLEGHQSYVTDVEFTSDAKRLASSSADQTVRLWDLETFEELAVCRGLAQEVWEVELTPDDRFVIAGGKRGAIYTWETAVLQKPDPPIVATNIDSCAVAAEGNRIALQTKDGSLRLGEIGQSIRWKEATFAGTNNTAVNLSQDGRLLIAGKENGSVSVYDVASEKETHAMSLFDSMVLSVEALDSNRAILAGDLDHNLTLVRLGADGGKEVWRTAIDELANRPSFAFAITPNERILATGNFFGRVILLDLTNGRELCSVPNSSSQPDVQELDFSPEGRTLATADASGVVGLWDVTAFSMDGFDGAESAFERRTTLDGHRNSSGAVLFLPEGNRLVSAGNGDEAVIIWDLTSKQELLRLPARGKIAQLQFSAPWSLLMGLTEEGDLYAWRAPP